MIDRPRGRPRRYAEYERLLESLPRLMSKRPKYVNGIGIFRGKRGEIAWIKIRLPRGGAYKGKAYAPGKSLEIKLGQLSSWSWEKLEAELARYQGRADRGEPLEDEPSVLFSDWARDWLERSKQRVKAYGTLKIHVENHLIPTFGGKLLNAVKAPDVNRWIATQLKGSKPGTVKRQFNTLRAIFNDALKADQIETNPCRYADPIRGAVGRQRFLSAEEMVKLLLAAEEVEEWLSDYITWALHSGMRKGEMLALKWSNIHELADGRIVLTIEQSKSDQPRMVIGTTTMKEILDRQFIRKKKDDDALFPISTMTLRRKWKLAREKAGLEDVTVHDLRRTHSTHAAASGVDLRTLADRIGHTDLTMLQKHYAAVVGTAATEAADTIQSVFDGMTKGS
jgi:integrase